MFPHRLTSPGMARRSKPAKESLASGLGLTPAELLRVLPAGVIVAALAALGAMQLARTVGLAPLPALFLALVCGIVGFLAGILLVRMIAMGTAQTIASAILPSGATTPSRADHSREDALLMQRDIRGALDSFEAKIAADPSVAHARLRAADLYAADGGDPARAAALFREVQRLPGISMRDDVYASNRLVDLYDGQLASTGRAIVELRRIIDRYPGTRAEEEARRGLATLKARHLDATDGSTT